MSAERRTSFRFLVRPEMKSAKLRWRSHALSVELIDQSATGFSFKAPKDTNIKLNEIVSLKSWAGDCEAIVVRLTQQRDYLRVGLERTTDIIARPLPTRLLSRCLSWRPEAPSQFTTSFVRKHWIAACLILGVATVATCLAARDDDGDPVGEASDAAPDLAVAARELAAPASDATPGNPQSLAAKNPSLAPAGTNSSTSATFERLMALRNSKTSDALGLSQRQKLEISQLLGDLSSGVAKIKPQATRRGQARRAAKINALIAAADGRLAQILTEEQHARWLIEP